MILSVWIPSFSLERFPPRPEAMAVVTDIPPARTHAGTATRSDGFDDDHAIPHVSPRYRQHIAGFGFFLSFCFAIHHLLSCHRHGPTDHYTLSLSIHSTSSVEVDIPFDSSEDTPSSLMHPAVVAARATLVLLTISFCFSLYFSRGGKRNVDDQFNVCILRIAVSNDYPPVHMFPHPSCLQPRVLKPCRARDEQCMRAFPYIM